ncbi:MAG TPA: hypothetical protein VFH83_04840, partial [Spirochaetia bacterium]|nr:hypothetical protein [Spirochaetia bacterium]
MLSLVLKVSKGVPALPPAIREEKGLIVQRINHIDSDRDGAPLVAWLLDTDFLTQHHKALSAGGVADGSVLAWNPDGETDVSRQIPGGLLYDEVASLDRPTLFLRTLRNLYRRLHLEREVAEKDRLLKARESQNSDLLQIGIALSAERNNDKLLGYILKQLRLMTAADSGTLYLLER